MISIILQVFMETVAADVGQTIGGNIIWFPGFTVGIFLYIDLLKNKKFGFSPKVFFPGFKLRPSLKRLMSSSVFVIPKDNFQQ